MSDGFYVKWTRAGRVPSYRRGVALPPPGVWSDGSSQFTATPD